MRRRVRRYTIEGYLYMGEPQIPPLPAKIGLTDRADGVIYYLLTSGTFPSLTLALSSAALTDNVAGINVYGAFDGPVVDDIWRLYVQSGVLAVEETQYTQSQTRIFARNANSTQAVEVTAPDGVLTETNVQL